MEASDSSANAAPERKGVKTNSSGLASSERTGSGQELRMSKHVNLRELGLRRSPRLKALLLRLIRYANYVLTMSLDNL